MTYPSPISVFRTWPYWPVEGAARRTVGPTIEPVTLDEVKDHLRNVPTADEDALLQSYIVAARAAMEELLSKPLLSQTFEFNLSRFPAWELGLPRTGQLGMQDLLTSVTSVAYIDANGNPQTLATSAYIVDAHHADYARLLPYGLDAGGHQTMPTYWPPTRYVPNAATVTYVTGLANRAGPNGVPEDIRLALLQTVGTLYENRESTAAASSVIERLPMFDDLVTTHRSTWEPEWL